MLKLSLGSKLVLFITFYKQLLKKMKAKGMKTAKTEEFIAEMKDIEKIIVVFLKSIPRQLLLT